MKTQKGFATIVAIIIGLVIVGGGIYALEILNDSEIKENSSEKCILDDSGIDYVPRLSVSLKTSIEIGKESRLMGSIADGWINKSIDLINEGSDVNYAIKDKEGGFFTPLMTAAATGNTQVTKCLLSKGADPMVVNDQGRNALMFASVQGRVGAVELLASDGRSVNTFDKKGRTPLILGVMSRNIDIVESLLEAGANVNARDKEGMTALLWASSSELCDIVNLLLDAGADASIENEGGMSVVDYLTGGSTTCKDEVDRLSE